MTTIKDLTGQRFGKVIVQKFIKTNSNHKSVWLCVCDCGKSFDALGTNLISGKTKSCGCLRGKQRIDYSKYVGKRFGKLVVLERKDINNKYKCLCDCGNIVFISPGNLSYTKSCGCSRIKATGIDRLFFYYEKQAKNRNLEFSLDKEYFKLLVNGECAYCGNPPSSNLRGYKYIGIDRVDNNKGYIKGNVVSCCKTCNFAKRTMPLEEFKSWIVSVYRRIIKQQDP